jgi:hypothetical protein
MKYKIAIMAHKSREKYFLYLKKELKTELIFIDDGSLGVWGNAKRAWLAFDPDCDFHIVIQDDAIIGKDFHKRLDELLKERICYSLYFQHKNKNKDPEFNLKIKEGGFKHDKLHWGLGIAMPTKLIPEMLSYCDKLDVFGDDMKIKEFLLHKGVQVEYQNPTLIDHRIDEISLIGNGDNKKRRSPCFY